MQGYIVVVCRTAVSLVCIANTLFQYFVVCLCPCVGVSLLVCPCYYGSTEMQTRVREICRYLARRKYRKLPQIYSLPVFAEKSRLVLQRFKKTPYQPFLDAMQRRVYEKWSECALKTVL